MISISPSSGVPPPARLLQILVPTPMGPGVVMVSRLAVSPSGCTVIHDMMEEPIRGSLRRIKEMVEAEA